ncbi:uncharacterized protein METZ01_LOCUS290084 [marine metagenome]|uniref:Carrier domain-containing protein n=1 Tax=marine metagenome TaxID=408172 RepID=A0A382LKU1_9ZZZZ
MIKEKVMEALHEHFGQDKVIEPKHSIIDDLDGDDMDMIEVCCAIEEKAGITMPEDKMENLVTVEDIIKLAESC